MPKLPYDHHRLSIFAKIWLAFLGVMLVLAGLFFFIGGIKLISLAGSYYFAISGFAVILSGLLILMRRPIGAWIFGLVTILTVIWAVFDAGFEFWPLISRLLTFSVAATVIALSYPLLRRARGLTPAYPASLTIAALTALISSAAFAGMFIPHPTVAFLGAPEPFIPVSPDQEQKNWSAYGNTSGGSRFVALDQINRDNISELKVAWTYHTGDTPLSLDGNGAEDQQTPLQVGNRIFLCTPHNNVIALDADTGKEIWKNLIDAHSSVWMRCRGLAYFDATLPLIQPTAPNSTPVIPVSVPEGAPCQRRILMNTINAVLVALDADTGEFCPDFGTNGRVNLKIGLGDAPDPEYVLTSPPTVAGTTVVVGGRIADNVQVDMPGGVMRGFDVVTGELRWAFDPGNPNITKFPEEGQTYTRSTPNVWSTMSYDPETNIVFMPVGSPSVDLYGATRTPLDHKYGASMLALDGTTGREKWVFQTVRNDLWDFDVPMQPSFINFTKTDGTIVPALVFGTKAGQLFVLDRATGQTLTTIIDVPMKAGKIPGEPYPATQPLSTGMPQIGTQTLKESDMWGVTPFDQLLCRISFRSMRYEGLYTVPGTDLVLNFPGSLGGMNWGGLSIDPTTDTIFANDMRLGLWIQMFEQTNHEKIIKNNSGETPNTGMGSVPMKGTPYSVTKNRFLSIFGIPCQKPPFGTLTAVNMKTRQIKWQVPVGTVQDTGPFGIKMRLPIPIGMPTLGGTLATQGGLLFIAGTQDYYLRAFDSATGKELWKGRLPVGSQGGPISYKSPQTGKQYVVISAGGARQSPDRGDYVIAYSLP